MSSVRLASMLWFAALIGVCAAAFLAGPALADPWPHQVLKFQQLPMHGVLINQKQYWGHDEESQLVGIIPAGGNQPNMYTGQAMADDFSDYLSQPIQHLRWWGSYINMLQPPAQVQKFLVVIESDVPANPDIPGSFSHPGQVLWSQILLRDPNPQPGPPAPGFFKEKFVPAVGQPGPVESLYEYNAELAPMPWQDLFAQREKTVYWLKIAALVDVSEENPTPPFKWGWHNRDYTVKDLLACTPPAVVPGEHVQGFIPDPSGAMTPIWHHQDNAVASRALLLIAGPEPLVEQYDFRPQHYVDFLDGPGQIEGFPGIVQFSKDLAFEVYAVPEPGALALLLAGAAVALGAVWFKRNKP